MCIRDSYWRGGAAARPAWNVTVQLLPLADTAPIDRDEDEPTGPPVAQHDGPPAEGGRPAQGWRGGGGGARAPPPAAPPRTAPPRLPVPFSHLTPPPSERT